MTFKEYIFKNLGKSIDFDGIYSFQCCDLVNDYMQKCFNVFTYYPYNFNAQQYFTRFNEVSALVKNFTKISNTPDFVPMQGDICVFTGSVERRYDEVQMIVNKIEMVRSNHEFKEDNNININNPTLLPRKVDIQDPPVRENVSKEILQNSITDVERDIQKENNVSTFKRTNTTDLNNQSQSKRIN